MNSKEGKISKKVLREFIIGAVIITLATTAGYLIAPIEVRFLSALTTNSFLIGLTFGLGSILFGLLSIWLGRLSDRMGRNRFIIIGCALGIVYPLLYASTYNIYQYMGFKVVWAFATATTGPIFMAYLQDLLKQVSNPGHYIGIVFAIQSVLGAIAQFLGGFLSDRYGFSMSFIAMSAVFALALAVAFFELGFKKSRKHFVEKKSLFFGFSYIWKKPQLVFYFINNTTFSLNWGIKNMLWPLIIFGLSSSDTVTGMVFATMGITAFVILLFVGRIVDRIGPFSSTLVAFLLLGVSGLVISFTGNLSILWVAAAFFAIGEAINGPAQVTLLTKYVHNKHRGEIMGIDALSDRVLNTLAPMGAGFMLLFFSAQKVLLVFVALIWVSWLVSIFMMRSSCSLRA